MHVGWIIWIINSQENKVMTSCVRFFAVRSSSQHERSHFYPFLFTENEALFWRLLKLLLYILNLSKSSTCGIGAISKYILFL